MLMVTKMINREKESPIFKMIAKAALGSRNESRARLQRLRRMTEDGQE